MHEVSILSRKLRGILDRLPNVLNVDEGILTYNVLRIASAGNQLKDELHAQPRALDARLAAKNFRITFDAVEHTFDYTSDMPRCVTVFCSSSNDVPQEYFQAARELGAAIAREGWTLIYGGGSFGLMGAVSRAAGAAGGKVIGVIPHRLLESEKANHHCDELIVVDDMRQRKAMLDSRCDAFITLPGGIGTLEELFEMLVGKYLGYHDKPIVLMNVNRFFDPLVELLNHGIQQRFIHARTRELLHVAASVQEVIAALSPPGATRVMPGDNAPPGAGRSATAPPGF